MLTGLDVAQHRLLRPPQALRGRSEAWSCKALGDGSREACGAGA